MATKLIPYFSIVCPGGRGPDTGINTCTVSERDTGHITDEYNTVRNSTVSDLMVRKRFDRK